MHSPIPPHVHKVAQRLRSACAKVEGDRDSAALAIRQSAPTLAFALDQYLPRVDNSLPNPVPPDSLTQQLAKIIRRAASLRYTLANVEALDSIQQAWDMVRAAAPVGASSARCYINPLDVMRVPRTLTAAEPPDAARMVRLAQNHLLLPCSDVFAAMTECDLLLGFHGGPRGLPGVRVFYDGLGEFVADPEPVIHLLWVQRVTAWGFLMQPDGFYLLGDDAHGDAKGVVKLFPAPTPVLDQWKVAGITPLHPYVEQEVAPTV